MPGCVITPLNRPNSNPRPKHPRNPNSPQTPSTHHSYGCSTSSVGFTSYSHWASPNNSHRVHVPCIPARNSLLSSRKGANPRVGGILGRGNDPHAEIFQSFILDVCYVRLPSVPYLLIHIVVGSNRWQCLGDPHHGLNSRRRVELSLCRSSKRRIRQNPALGHLGV